MAGRPPLRIGQRGRVSRRDLGGGIWLARCRFRDDDGVVRLVERRTPPGVRDQRGRVAEEALLDALDERRRPSTGNDVTGRTHVIALCRVYVDRLAEKNRSPATITTYTTAVDKLEKFLAGVRVVEARAGKIDGALQLMSAAHGATMSRQAKTVLRGALGLAVLADVLDANPVNEVGRIESSQPAKGAPSIPTVSLPSLLHALRNSDFCVQHDLVDPFTLLLGTGVRRSELLAIRWEDVDDVARTVSITGKVVRVKGEGLARLSTTKSASGLRTLVLPQFALDMLKARAKEPSIGNLGVVFPSTVGTLRDPNNMGKQWRAVRDELGLSEITTHSFRKTLATLIDAEGLSARVGADQLGHRQVSMTQDKYWTRGRQHVEVADMLDRATAISDE
ncbi:site-specific integrase [Rhodococcus sp. BP-241]|nr:site-specific integrase [Rhodococcus sp. BP-241]